MYILLGMLLVFMSLATVCAVSYAAPEISIVTEYITMDDVLQRARTFDLVAVSYRALSCTLVKMFTKSHWSHVGLVYRTSATEIAVIEALRLHETKTNSLKTEILVTPWSTWLKRNAPFPMLYVPQRHTVHGSVRKTETLVTEVVKCQKQNVRVNMSLFDWTKTLKYTKRTVQTDESDSLKTEFFCTEFIAHLLQVTGTVPGYKHCANYTPVELLFYGAAHYENPKYIVPRL